MASNWNALRGRLGALAGEIEALLGDGVRGERESLAARAAEAVARLLDAGKTSILLRDDAEGQPAGRGMRPAASSDSRSSTRSGVGEGVAGRAVAHGEAIVVADIGLDPRFDAAPARSLRVELVRRDAARCRIRAFRRALCDRPARRHVVRRGGRCAAAAALAHAVAVCWIRRSRCSTPISAILEEAALILPEADPRRDGSARRRPEGDSELARLVCDAMTREVEPTRVLGSALRAVSECLDAAPVSVYLLEAESGVLRREAQWEADRRPRIARCCRAKRVSPGPRSRADSRSPAPRRTRIRASMPSADTPEGGAVGPLLVLPIRFRGRTLGVCRVFSADPRAASPRTAEVLGAALSAAVRNVLLYRSLVESIEEVARARKEAAE